MKIGVTAELQRERNKLLDQWSKSKGKQRVKILVQLIDLEEEIQEKWREKAGEYTQKGGGFEHSG